jgi:Tol biopolymer transport system component/DNA-binding winged helix-turn-helix (wHTH) protein
MKMNTPFKVGNCHIIPFEYSIQFEGAEKQSIQAKFIEVLCYLAKHAPRVIPRDELINNIWQGNEYVGEKALTNAIWHLRHNLKGADGENEIIETIRKVGYRLLITPIYEEVIEEQPIVSKKTINKSDTTLKINDKKHNLLYLLLTFFIGVLLWQSLKEKEFVQPHVTQITKSPGGEMFVAPSPNGQYLAYKWLTPDGESNLYLQDREHPEAEAKQLTFDEALEGHSVWSNSGKYLYFSRKNSSKKLCNIIQLNVKTRQEKVITKCPVAGGYYYLDISPDDNTLAYHGRHLNAKDSGIYFISLIEDIAQPVRFSCLENCKYRERDVAFSPDGIHVAVTRRFSRFNENIFLVNLATKTSTQLTFKEQDIVGLSWHPSGKKLVYGAQRADIRSGYILNISDKSTYNLQLEGFSYPAFARKSGELFYQQRPENYYIARLSLNNTVASSPLPVIQSTYNHLYPHYSKTNKKIVYLSNESGYYELWSADANGKNREQLTNLQQTIRYPRWSHDGAKIAFLSPVEEQHADKIFILNIKNKTLSTVVSPFAIHNRPTWSWDDKAILTSVITDDYRDIHLFNIKEKTNHRVTFNGGRYGIMVSAEELLYSRNSRGLWKTTLLSKIDKETFNATKVIDKKMSNAYAWAYRDKDGQQELFFKQSFLQYQQISHYSFSTELMSPLIQVPIQTLGADFSITIEDDNNSLLLTRGRFPQIDIKMLTHPLLTE